MKCLMRVDELHECRPAAKLRDARAMQPLAHLATVVPADGLGIELFMPCGCWPQFAAPVCMRLDGIVQIDAHIAGLAATSVWRRQIAPLCALVPDRRSLTGPRRHRNRDA